MKTAAMSMATNALPFLLLFSVYAFGIRAKVVSCCLQRFSAVIMRIRDPKTTALIFASGKVVSSLMPSDEQSRLRLSHFDFLLWWMAGLSTIVDSRDLIKADMHMVFEGGDRSQERGRR